MKIYNVDKGNGTAISIREAHDRHIPIITATDVRRDVTKMQAHEMGYNDVHVYSVKDWTTTNARFLYHSHRVIVDNLEDVLSAILESKAMVATTTSRVIDEREEA